MAPSIIARGAPAQTLARASTSPDTREDISNWFRDFHRPLIKVLASRRVVPHGHLDDLVQETFLRAWRYSDLEEVQNVLGYLITIAMNLASEWKQLSANRNPHLADSVLAQQPCDDSERPDTRAELVERNRCVRAALDTLPSRRRSVHILQCRDDLSYSQIARRLGVTTRVVNREINVGHRELRLALARAGLAHAASVRLDKPIARENDELPKVEFRRFSGETPRCISRSFSSSSKGAGPRARPH